MTVVGPSHEIAGQRPRQRYGTPQAASRKNRSARPRTAAGTPLTSFTPWFIHAGGSFVEEGLGLGG